MQLDYLLKFFCKGQIIELWDANNDHRTVFRGNIDSIPLQYLHHHTVELDSIFTVEGQNNTIFISIGL